MKIIIKSISLNLKNYYSYFLTVTVSKTGHAVAKDLLELRSASVTQTFVSRE